MSYYVLIPSHMYIIICQKSCIKCLYSALKCKNRGVVAKVFTVSSLPDCNEWYTLLLCRLSSVGQPHLLIGCRLNLRYIHHINIVFHSHKDCVFVVVCTELNVMHAFLIYCGIFLHIICMCARCPTCASVCVHECDPSAAELPSPIPQGPKENQPFGLSVSLPLLLCTCCQISSLFSFIPLSLFLLCLCPFMSHCVSISTFL